MGLIDLYKSISALSILSKLFLPSFSSTDCVSCCFKSSNTSVSDYSSILGIGELSYVTCSINFWIESFDFRDILFVSIFKSCPLVEFFGSKLNSYFEFLSIDYFWISCYEFRFDFVLTNVCLKFLSMLLEMLL